MDNQSNTEGVLHRLHSRRGPRATLMQEPADRLWKLTGVTIVDCRVHGVDRNSRYDAGEKEPGDTNPDRKCARERLSRYDIAIANREAGDEGEIDCVAERPALKKTNQ